MEPEEKVVCMCENCGNEAEMTIRCEVAVPIRKTALEPAGSRFKRTLVCTRCGNEADMIVDYAEG
jgi:thymidine kinase